MASGTRLRVGARLAPLHRLQACYYVFVSHRPPRRATVCGRGEWGPLRVDRAALALGTNRGAARGAPRATAASPISHVFVQETDTR